MGSRSCQAGPDWRLEGGEGRNRPHLGPGESTLTSWLAVGSPLAGARVLGRGVRGVQVCVGVEHLQGPRSTPNNQVMSGRLQTVMQLKHYKKVEGRCLETVTQLRHQKSLDHIIHSWM